MDETPHWNKRVVVGIDGSADAIRALRLAAEEAVLRDAQLDVVHVWSPPYAGSPLGGIVVPVHEDEYRDIHHDLLDKAVDSVMRGLDKRPRHVDRLLIKDASAARTLLQTAKGADLLVVGSRGRGGFTGLLLGSVSQQCVHHAHCPVMVVHAFD